MLGVEGSGFRVLGAFGSSGFRAQILINVNSWFFKGGHRENVRVQGLGFRA